MKKALRTHVAAALLLLPVSAAFLAPAAVAQQRVQPAIAATSLNSSAGLGPGAVLWLRVSATPGGRDASVTLGNSGIRVPLRESKPGIYTGSFTIRTTDRIDPMQLLAVRVTVGGQPLWRNFTYPPAFQALVAPAPAAGGVASAPVIDRFEVRPGGRLLPGRELQFTLTGQPRADASFDIPGVVRGVDLKEVRPGVYQGSYTVRRADDLGKFDNAVATLRRGPLRTTAQIALRTDDDRRGGDRDPRGDRGDRDRDHRDGPRGEQRGERDLIPPKISRLSPGDKEVVNERQRTRISARIADDGSGIDPASVLLRVDGLDVTKNTSIAGDEVRYREELGRGKHNAELVVRDRAGNIARTTWSFQVQ